MNSLNRPVIPAVLLLVVAVLLGGCSETDPGLPPAGPASMADIQVPDGFKFATRVDHDLCVQVENVNGEAYPEVLVTVFSLTGEELAQGQTDPSGQVALSFALSNLESQVQVTAPAIGVVLRDTTLTLEEVTGCLVIH